MTKPFLLTMMLAGLVLGAMPGLAQDTTTCKPDDTWQEVEIFAVRVDPQATKVPTLVILKDHAFHDTAVIWSGGTIEWSLSCMHCIVDSSDEVEFVIADPKFVGDLDEMTHEAAEVASPDPDVPLPPGLEVKRGKPHTPPGHEDDFFGPGKSKKGAKSGARVASDLIPGLDNASELWKYGVMVEVDVAGQPATQNCIQTTTSGEVTKFDPDCCAAKALCDYWDPHIYMHGDMDF